MKTKSILLTLAVAAVTGIPSRADVPDIDIHIGGEIRLGHRPPPPPLPVVTVTEDSAPKGPVPWEHGHWYQRSQTYYYYPADNVYYRPADNMWFYEDRGQWRSGRGLPESVRIDFNRSVSLTMATDRPYDYHPQVVTRYPANYFGARVRLRDEERHENRSDDRRDYDKPGHDDHGSDRDKDNEGRDKPRDRDDRR